MISYSTIVRGLHELKSGASAEPGRVRRPGGGRKSSLEKDPNLLRDLEALVEPTSSGDPESALRWTSKSVRNIFVNIELLRRRGEVTETVFHAGGASLAQCKRWLPDSCCFAFLEYPVKSPADLGTLLRIVESYRFHSTEKEFAYLTQKWGEEGVPIAPLPRFPLSALIVDWMGLVNFTFAFLDDPGPIRSRHGPVTGQPDGLVEGGDPSRHLDPER